MVFFKAVVFVLGMPLPKPGSKAVTGWDWFEVEIEVE